MTTEPVVDQRPQYQQNWAQLQRTQKALRGAQRLRLIATWASAGAVLGLSIRGLISFF